MLSMLDCAASITMVSSGSIRFVFCRLLFWSDWGKNPHIGRMDMDGRNVRLIISESLKWPNGLVVDLVTKWLFWADAGKHYIGTVTHTVHFSLPVSRPFCNHMYIIVIEYFHC